jgi:TatA/E family protein of Tat protein translocase
MFGIGMPELILILVVALLILGPKRLPEVARSLGRGMVEFRRASSELRNSLTIPPEEPPAAAQPEPEQRTEAAQEPEGVAKPEGNDERDEKTSDG